MRGNPKRAPLIDAEDMRGIVACGLFLVMYVAQRVWDRLHGR